MRVELLLLAAALLVSCAQAAEIPAGDTAGAIDKPVTADTPDKFAVQAAHVRGEMKPGGRYEFIRDADRRRVDLLLNHTASLLDHYGSVAAMHRDTQIELFNTQEEINGILRHNDDMRLVCERRAKIGSNIPETTCRTVGDIERNRRAGNQAILDLNNSSRHQTASDVGDRRGGG